MSDVVETGSVGSSLLSWPVSVSVSQSLGTTGSSAVAVIGDRAAACSTIG